MTLSPHKTTIISSAMLWVTLFFSPAVFPQGRAALFPLSDVSLSESPFQRAQRTDYQYIMALNPDRLLAPFLREAGLQPKAASYEDWENTGLDGHIGGHYLSALANMYAATHQAEVLQRLQYMVQELARCQAKNDDGYVGGIPGGRSFWKDIASGKIEASGFSLNGKWVPWYNMHKLFAGLTDAYRIAGLQNAKAVLLRLADWALQLTSGLSDEQMQRMLRCEQGGMNEALADVAAISGDDKYLQLAKRFSHRFILNPLLNKKDSLTGLHANTQIPKVIGFVRIAEINHDTTWANAASFFWQTVVKNRTVVFGGNSVREHFNPVNDFSSMLESREGPETCNSYNMLKLTKHLFMREPSGVLMDYYERTLYNHILSSQHPQGGFVYYTPIRPRQYRVYSKVQSDFWCCVGTGLENHGKYGELIYAHDTEGLYVNLFIPSVLDWKEKGITVSQKTGFPFEEKTTISFSIKSAKRFAVKIRKPSWVNDQAFEISVNGRLQSISVDENSYVNISRLWKNGDAITVQLPMQTKAERLPDGSDWAAFVHGPLVLAAITDTMALTGLTGDGIRMGQVASGPLTSLESVPTIIANTNDLSQSISKVKGRPLSFRITGKTEPAAVQNLLLVPFYNIHDARYIMYWPFATTEGFQQKLASRKAEQQRLMALEQQTIDQVAPGEQQPESDHNLKGEKTESGMHADRHWRHAQGWFSYDLRNSTKNARALRVTYWGSDNNRSFDILANNVQIATVRLDGKAAGKFVDVDYLLPTAMAAEQPGIINVTFRAHPQSVAGGIFGLRLLK